MAAFTVDILVYPLDTIKTRYQARQLSIGWAALKEARGLYQGVGSVVFATLPAGELDTMRISLLSETKAAYFQQPLSSLRATSQPNHCSHTPCLPGLPNQPSTPSPRLVLSWPRASCSPPPKWLSRMPKYCGSLEPLNAASPPHSSPFGCSGVRKVA